MTNDNVIFVNANFNEEFWNKWTKIDLKKMEGNEATHVVALHCIGNLIKDNFKTLKNKNYETKELEYLALLQKILKRK
ncbi:MAG: hypothetical protein GY870_11245 [archaeon]|nr:hypothetical protein [archaeon]